MLRARLILAVVGEKGSGKTKVVEELVRALKAKGLKVSTAKHVPEEGFSLDRPGKDSWRHAEAGADAVTLVAPREVSTIRRVRTGELGPDEILTLASQGCDVLIMEGFSSIFGRDPRVLKIVVVKEPEKAVELEASGALKPILAFVGPGGLGEARPRAPYFGFEELGALADKIADMLAGKERRASLFLDGEEVPLNPFVRELLRKLVLAFASCLKGVELAGDEEVAVLIRRKGGEGKG